MKTKEIGHIKTNEEIADMLKSKVLKLIQNIRKIMKMRC